jgi:hypothetical protein
MHLFFILLRVLFIVFVLFVIGLFVDLLALRYWTCELAEISGRIRRGAGPNGLWPRETYFRAHQRADLALGWQKRQL